METRLTYRQPNGIPPNRQPRTQFTGVGDLAASAVQVIDSNPLLGLIASDSIGMIAPRSAINYYLRGADDGRETLLRESAGLIGNVFLLGWLGHLTLKVLGNRKTFYNPKAIPTEAWIHAGSLEAFGNLYNTAMTEAKGNPTNARQRLIHKVLDGIESSDRNLSLKARIQGLSALPDNTSEAKKLKHRAVEQFIRESMPTPAEGTTLIDTIIKGKDKTLSNTEALIQALTANPEEAVEKLPRVGKLNTTQIKAFEQYYSVLSEKSPSAGIGTYAFDAMAERALNDQFAQTLRHESRPDLAEAVLKGPFLTSTQKADIQQLTKRNYDADLLKTRLSLSNSRRPELKAFGTYLDNEALHAGLTDTVNLRDAQGNLLTGDKSRKTLLVELKHYLEQYVDRAAKIVERSGSKADAWQTNMQQQLFARKTGWLQNPLPRLDDGLVTSALKAKRLYTGIPFFFSFVFSGAVTFYNMYLTSKIHGGRIFFPGEGDFSMYAGTNQGNGAYHRFKQREAASLPASNFIPAGPIQIRPSTSAFMTVNTFAGQPAQSALPKSIPFQSPVYGRPLP